MVSTGPGSSDYTIYKEGFHDTLSRYWPEPREQLHAGGWRKTYEMVEDIKRLAAGGPGGISRVLDLCCGEGATAVHVAAVEGWEVTGVEIVESAVKVARELAEQYGTVVRVKLATAESDGAVKDGSPVRFSLSYGTAVGVKLGATETDGAVKDGSPVRFSLSYDTVVGAKVAMTEPPVRLSLSYQTVGDLVRIAHASVQYMPLPSNSYDVVYGQDADGLANEHRINVFREVLRVLRPGGLFYFWHHWIPGPGWPAELLAEYWADPLTGSPRLSYECYLEDLQASGLQVASVCDCTQLAAHHMGGMAARMRVEAPQPDGSLPDKWLERALQFAERGGTMGIQVVAYKPL